MGKRTYLLISGAIFTVAAVLHLARLLLGLPVRIGDHSLPTWFSWGGLLLATVLSVWGFRLACR
jgi:hypothetical protein